MRTDVHPNSVEAYHAEKPNLSRRARMVLAWIRLHGRATDRQVAYGMGFGENLNAVRPRITELVDAGELRETHNVRCHVTGKTVRVVDVPAGQEELFA